MEMHHVRNGAAGVCHGCEHTAALTVSRQQRYVRHRQHVGMASRSFGTCKTSQHRILLTVLASCTASCPAKQTPNPQTVNSSSKARPRLLTLLTCCTVSSTESSPTHSKLDVKHQAEWRLLTLLTCCTVSSTARSTSASVVKRPMPKRMEVWA